MRYGIYGGSFDPVHLGHLWLAESCLRGAGLDRVIFVPTGTSPHKQRKKHVAGELRAQMLELAIAGIPEFLVSRFEIERDSTSYTIETLRHFKETLPDAELFLLVGADTYHDLPNWYKAAEVLELAVPVGVHRPGFPPLNVDILAGVASSERLKLFQDSIVEMPQIDISATQIRQNLLHGKSIRFLTPCAVDAFIDSHDLYREMEY